MTFLLAKSADSCMGLLCGGDSVANVSQLITVDRDFLTERVGKLRGHQMREANAGLKLILAL